MSKKTIALASKGISGRFAKKQTGGRKTPEVPSRKEICVGDRRTPHIWNRHVSWRFSRKARTMLLEAVRNGLGQAIILADFASRLRKLQRNTEAQAGVKRALWNLSLYQFRARPLCVKTRRAMYRLNLPTQPKDAMNDPQARQALLEDGGKAKMPCLRIGENGQVHQMYEPSEIIVYLEGRFADA